MKPLIQFLSETSGFCCQWAFMCQKEYVLLTNKELAGKLGVSVRTVGEVRSAISNGGFGCKRTQGCAKGLAKISQVVTTPSRGQKNR